MKKIISMITALIMILALGLVGCSESKSQSKDDLQKKESYTVGVCQLMAHDSLDAATKGFTDALTQEIEAAGKTVTINVQVAGETSLCATVINTFTAKNVDLIMANATPALLSAANATDSIPILGTSVTDYTDTFGGKIPGNVSGTSDAVPFDEQAQMMIDTLKLVSGDKVGVLYCSNESNSKIQYEAVKALFEEQGIVVEAYTFAETMEMQAVITKMTSECKAVYVPSDNTVATNDSIVGNICNEQNIPVFTSYGGNICYASLAIDYYALGAETGKMAADILLGRKSISEIEIATLTPSVVYNNDLCAALGIEVPNN